MLVNLSGSCKFTAIFGNSTPQQEHGAIQIDGSQLDAGPSSSSGTILDVAVIPPPIFNEKTHSDLLEPRIIGIAYPLFASVYVIPFYSFLTPPFFVLP